MKEHKIRKVDAISVQLRNKMYFHFYLDLKIRRYTLEAHSETLHLELHLLHLLFEEQGFHRLHRSLVHHR